MTYYSHTTETEPHTVAHWEDLKQKDVQSNSQSDAFESILNHPVFVLVVEYVPSFGS